MNDILELETRRKIYNLILENPGLHLSKIAEILKMRISLVEYHLIFLEKNEIITPVRESGYTRFYVFGEIGIKDKKILSLLRQEIPLRIILFLLKSDSIQHKDILENIDVAPSTLSYHLKKLVKHSIIATQTYGEERGYSIINKQEIIKLLVKYKPYNLIESFKDIWVDLKIE